MAVFSNLRDIEVELETLTHRMSEVDPTSDEYVRVADRFHRLDSQLDASIRRTLALYVSATKRFPRPSAPIEPGWVSRACDAGTFSPASPGRPSYRPF